MSVSNLLVAYALAGLPVGLLTGLGLGLVARHEGGWGGYSSFRRRAARLGHVCTVMLPLIAGFYGLALGAHGPARPALADVGARLWIGGGVALALALFAAAWRPRTRVALPVPALAVVAGAVCLALSFLNA